MYIKDYQSEYKELGAYMNNINLEKFILATPFATSDQKTSFDRKLNTQSFFDLLYLNTVKAELLIKDINENVDYGYNNVILSGYKGCGKTTFVNYFVNKKDKARYRLINFDHYVDKDHDIKSTVLLFFYRLVEEDWHSDNCKVLNTLYKIYYMNDNDIFFNGNIDSTGVFEKFITWIMCFVSENNHDRQKSLLVHDFKQILNEMNVIQLLILLILFDLSARYLDDLNPRCYIVFDNLDVFFNDKELEDFTRDISIFRNDISYILDNVTIDGLTKIGYNPFQDYTLIFCMRETTKCEFIEHFSDRGMEPYVTNEISKIYDKRAIIEKRYDFLKRMRYDPNFKNSDLLKKFEDFECLLEDSYISDNIFSLFNDDFRTSIRVLAKIVDDIYKEGSNCIEHINELRRVSSVDNWNNHAARCILLRRIYNLFIEEKYFDHIKSSEYQIRDANNEIKAINATRVILLYLSNCNTYHYSNNNTPLQYSVSLFNLLKDLSPFIKTDVTINTAWDLFDLRRCKYWNHLVTFDGLSDITLENLKLQAEKFENGCTKYSEYCKLDITEAGEFYLEYLLPHYEYFSSRVIIGGKSLFEFTSEEMSDLDLLENYISDVFEEVKVCCKKLTNFYNDFFVDKFNYSDRDYLGSKFSWHKFSESDNRVVSMFHSERIIHSHIGYLNDLRMYAFHMVDDDKTKIAINAIIVKYIEKYISLFAEANGNEAIALGSGQSDNLVELYKNCINKIKKNVYNDFVTSIDRRTGKALRDGN